jgi:hypothetical protein
LEWSSDWPWLVLVDDSELGVECTPSGCKSEDLGAHCLVWTVMFQAIPRCVVEAVVERWMVSRCGVTVCEGL